MLHMCRTCHGEATADNCIAINDNNVTSTRIKSQLLSCVPELQQDLVKDPVLCLPCVDALHSAYAFKAQCLQTEGRIQNYFQNTTLIAQNVTLLELYKEFIEAQHFIKLEDSTVKLSNRVPYNDADEVGDTKDFVIVHQVPFIKEEVYDMISNDLKNNSAKEDNEDSREDVAVDRIIKEEYEITQFKVNENNFQIDSSFNKLDKLQKSTNVKGSLKDIQTRDNELKELCLLNEAPEYIRKQILYTRKCFVKLFRIEDLHNPKLAGSTKPNEKSESAAKRYCCGMCTYATTKRSQLVKHMLIHSDNKYSQCDVCGFRTCKMSNLKRHMRTHTGEKPFKCNVCEYCTARKANLKVHTRTHAGDKPFQCNFCEFSASQQGHLKIHIRTHTGEKPFQCTICKYRATDRGSMNRHIRIHTGEKPFQCTICAFQTARQSTLNDHMRIHTGEKPFQCTICKFRCAYRMSLTQHMRTHTGEKPYQCTICEFRTISRGTLNQHMMTHTGKKPFQCTICEYRTIRRTTLNQHLRRHTGEKPFQCTICAFRAAGRSALNKHKRTHTN